MAGHQDFEAKQEKFFCNWCMDSKHCMTGRCYCVEHCGEPWCPALDVDDDYSPPVPTFK